MYATGKELLLPEFPLKIRLIGLRVTKLKDLEAPSSESGGIKRFFEPIETRSSSKKRRQGHNYDSNSEAARPDHDDDEYEDVMPGFHEHDENENELSLEDSNLVEPELEAPDNMSEERSRPQLVSIPTKLPVDGGCPSVPHARPHSTSSSKRISIHKPLSSHGFDREAEAINLETHECPLCGKTLQTDNTGLNAHVDFCLSRGAIREAQTEAGSLAKPASWFRREKESADKGKIASTKKRKVV